ncbi:hypothetical protein [Robertmurraya kyonggiensis]|uniref:Tissue inhibitor of metalloproteinase n=1 Tax=Robertmurraya kyonggiensis TaxID=1037680 RepID=A0A4U1D1M4_9BACI|nr:hypothetical protein [Robertmurraya kyonggiensis]TKC16152.1 hypothetical protein FA727_14435 [Robertmurraya kyonggiensis]
MKKFISIFAVCCSFLFLMVSFPSTSSACSCAEQQSVKEEFKQSKAVFSGKVIEVKENRRNNGSIVKLVLFEVTETWKGVDETQIIITTGVSDGDCGIEFKKGEEYLVYATESTMYGENKLVSTICDRTGKLQTLKDDLAFLGEGKSPAQKVDLTNELEGNHIYLIIVSTVIVMVLIVVFIVQKRKKT